MPENLYDPLDKVNLARSIVGALFQKEPRRLSDSSDLVGAGIYAIYYVGNHPLYESIAIANQDEKFGMPIYVGKAIPEGGRKGGLGLDASKGTAIRGRLRQHARSLTQVVNLDLEDFFYRSLIVDDIWIPLGENAVIEWFRPVWNVAVDGFGINEPGKGRKNQQKSGWDSLHPGRKLAEKLPANVRTVDQFEEVVRSFLAGDPMVALLQLEEDAPDG